MHHGIVQIGKKTEELVFPRSILLRKLQDKNVKILNKNKEKFYVIYSEKYQRSRE